MNRLVYLFYFFSFLFLPTVSEYLIVLNLASYLSMIMIDRRQLCNASDEQRKFVVTWLIFNDRASLKEANQLQSYVEPASVHKQRKKRNGK